jgi:hypothetical protein
MKTTREPTGTHRLDHRVRVADQIEEHLDRFRLAQVEHEAALAPVDVQVHQRRALDDGPCHLPHVVALRRLHLDDVGAEIGQTRRDGGRAQHRALDDAHVAQQLARCVSHGGRA